jgi:hypothetical protein
VQAGGDRRLEGVGVVIKRCRGGRLPLGRAAGAVVALEGEREDEGQQDRIGGAGNVKTPEACVVSWK